MYSRTVRGPMRILKEMWAKEPEKSYTCIKTSYEYVFDLRERY